MGFETECGSGDLSWEGGKISLAHLLSNCNRVKSRYGRKILFQLHKHRLGKEIEFTVTTSAKHKRRSLSHGEKTSSTPY